MNLVIIRTPSGRTAFAIPTAEGCRIVSLSGKLTNEIESDPEFGFCQEQAARVLRSHRNIPVIVLAQRKAFRLVKRGVQSILDAFLSHAR
jgi:hypothetical protein